MESRASRCWSARSAARSPPAEIKSDGTLVEENDLALALRAIPDDQRGWERTERHPCSARAARRSPSSTPTRVAQRCDFCGSPALVPYTETSRRPSVPRACCRSRSARDRRCARAIRQWYGSHWFAPNKLGRQALTDTLHGLYLPYWTFDAQCRALAGGGRLLLLRDATPYTTQGPQRRRGRCGTCAGSRRPASVDHFFDDELVPATQGVHASCCRPIEPFPTKELVPYDPRLPHGLGRRAVPDRPGGRRRTIAGGRWTRKVRALCARDRSPATPIAISRSHANYSGQTFKHVLLPVWLLSYVYGARRLPGGGQRLHRQDRRRASL